MDSRNIITTFAILAILISTNVFAWGVNSQYENSNPLKMQPGETKNVEFVLVHGTEEKTSIKAIASLIEGSEIAEIIGDKEFTLSPGTLVEDNKKIVLRISIPQSASIGESYQVKLSVTSIPEKEIATVQLNKGYVVDFPVIVGEESSVETVKTVEKQKVNTKVVAIIIALFIIIIIVILIVIFLKKKQAIK
ncbi:MAG: hypothetical protein AABX83_03130 [Nanoarchaeota archaeon]